MARTRDLDPPLAELGPRFVLVHGGARGDRPARAGQLGARARGRRPPGAPAGDRLAAGFRAGLAAPPAYATGSQNMTLNATAMACASWGVRTMSLTTDTYTITRALGYASSRSYGRYWTGTTSGTNSVEMP